MIDFIGHHVLYFYAFGLFGIGIFVSTLVCLITYRFSNIFIKDQNLSSLLLLLVLLAGIFITVCFSFSIVWL